MKQPPGAAGAGIVASQFLCKFLVAVDDPDAAFDVGLGRESLTTLGRHLEKSRDRRSNGACAWSPPLAEGAEPYRIRPGLSWAADDGLKGH